MEYGHGGDIYRNRNVELDFSVNVNPLGMPNFVWEAAQRSIAFCTGYPDSSCENLRGRLSEVTGVPGRSDDLRKRGGGIDLPAGTGDTAEKGSDPCAIFRGV